MKNLVTIVSVGLLGLAAACGGDDNAAGPDAAPAVQPRNPDTADKAPVDRFSASAGTLIVRDDTTGFPGPDRAIDFDSGEPFITTGLGPDGQSVKYYNFDVQPTFPIPIYVLFRTGEDAPVDGQLNIVDAVPGDSGYSDFWLVTKVTVPADYVANTVTSRDDPGRRLRHGCDHHHRQLSDRAGRLDGDPARGRRRPRADARLVPRRGGELLLLRRSSSPLSPTARAWCPPRRST